MKTDRKVGNSEKQNYKLICFDLDGTLIDETEYIWLTIYEHLSVDLIDTQKAAKKFWAKKITYEEWCQNDLSFLKEKNMHLKHFKEIAKKLKVMKGALETISELKKKGIKIAVISGSVDIMVDILFPKDIFDHVLINKIVFDKKGYVNDIVPTKYDCDEKATGLLMLCKKEKITTKECVFIGDNKNDISAAKAAGLAISFNSKSAELDSVCRVVIKEKDLRKSLKHIIS
jgi:phosphoserine phosphatase